MNRSPTIAAARFSSLLPAPIHPMQARLLALVAAHRLPDRRPAPVVSIWISAGENQPARA